MKTLQVVFFLTFMKFSFQTCTKFEIKLPTSVDFLKIKKELLKLKDRPTLADYKYVVDTEAAIAEHIAAYKNGMSNEDAPMSVGELIPKYGYKYEEYTVQTNDGYLLALHRIPGKGKPVFLMHGVFGSSADYIMAQKQSLAYLLSDAGYDVWLGNARGNTYSRKHVSISPDCGEFWDFSWNEIGNYDVPAFIDYILEETGQSKLHYIGYSQGTTVFLVMGALQPSYNDKIDSMIGLSPIAFMSHMKSPLLRILSANAAVEASILDALGVYEIARSDKFTKALVALVCGPNAIAEALCSNLLFVTTGFDMGNLNVPYLYTITQHTPAGSSTKQLKHFAQLVNSGRFCQYDYDTSGNIDKYGSVLAPSYDLSGITGKITWFRSDSDWLSNSSDVEHLMDGLPDGNVDAVYVKDYNHLDWVFGKNLKTDVYDKLIEILNNS